MKTNGEMRAEARDILRSGWFWRLLLVGIVLNFICYGVQGLVGAGFVSHGIDSKSIPALLFQVFVSYIFGAIVAFGMAGAMLKATANDSDRWFASSFGGFSRPLEVAWLLLLTNIRVALWSLLLVIPGLVAAYRYRQAWYLKNLHPDWSAWKCLGESGRMMDGYKWRAFSFDLSYIGWALLIGLGFGTSCGLAMAAKSGPAFLALIGSFVGLVTCWALCYVAVYYFVGRTVFYRELVRCVNVPSEGKSGSAESGEAAC